MAKANLKDAYYFSHDSNARNDEKILAMRSVYGAEGYGMYFMIIEILREQTGYVIEVNKYAYGSLAIQLQSSVKKVEKFINDCVNEFSLLTIKDDFLFSESLLRRMEIVDSVSEKRKNASITRWNKKNRDANGMQMDNKCKANDEQLESKEEENRIEENRIDKKIQNIIPPELEWVEKYCEERKNEIDVEKFMNYYTSNGWQIGKTKMKDWQAAIRTWEKNREVKPVEIKKQLEQPVKQEEESRFASLTEEERKMFFDRGAFMIDEDGECVDFSELTEEERIYLQKKGVI